MYFDENIFPSLILISYKIVIIIIYSSKDYICLYLGIIAIYVVNKSIIEHPWGEPK